MKVPKLFKEEFKERRFRKKILGRIYIESERDFVLQLYSRGSDDRYRRSPELSDDDAKRLKQLSGSIKKNKGVVRTGKVTLIAILVAAVLVFNFAFKNRLLEKALERGLEAVFSARADVEQLDFRLLSGRVSFSRLTVADQEQPMRNLFELGGSEADLNTNQLLKAKVVISNLEAREVRWHTPRQSSGALPEDREAEQKADRERAVGRGALGLNLGSLDAGALIDDQLAKLGSPARIAGLNSRLQTLQGQWQGRVEQGRTDVDELAGRIDAVRSIDVGSLDTVPELQQAVADIQQAATSLNRVRDDLRGVDRQIKTDREEIASARREFQEALDADVAYLYSLSDLSSGELKNLVSDLAAGYLQQILGRYYGYAQRARGYAQRLIIRKKEKPEDRKTVNRMQRGVDVRFTAAEYPRFLLENAGVSVQAASKNIQGSLQNVSSNPDLVDRPVSFSFLQTEGQKRLSVDGVLDSREQRDTDLKLGVQAAGFTFQLTEGLTDLGLSSLAAGYRLQTEFSRSPQGAAAEGQGLLELYDLVIQPDPGQKQLGRILYETLGSLSKVDVAFDYTIEGGKPVRIAARSSADGQLARALEERFTEISAQYKERLREELTARMASQIRENEALSQAFADLVQRSDGNLADTSAYEAVLARKRAEVEERVAGIRQQATDAAKSQLESQLEKLPLPKLKF
jgi:uncharacterized protein (TIGR03545 family)